MSCVCTNRFCFPSQNVHAGQILPKNVVWRWGSLGVLSPRAAVAVSLAGGGDGTAKRFPAGHACLFARFLVTNQLALATRAFAEDEAETAESIMLW